MKLVLCAVLVLLLFVSPLAQACMWTPQPCSSGQWRHVTWTTFVPDHYETVWYVAGYRVDAWGFIVPVYAYTQIWVPGQWVTRCMWKWYPF